MATSLAGILILAVFFTGTVMLWRANLAGTAIVASANLSAIQIDGEQTRTVPSITTSKANRNSNTLAVTVLNDGATSVPVSDFSKMDVVVAYDAGAQAPVRLTYTATNPPPAGQWTDAAMSGAFEPSVWNPAENLTIAGTLVGGTCAPGTVTVGLPNGALNASPFICGGLDLTFHSETADINGTTYFQLKDETPADGAASTVSVVFADGATGRQAPLSDAGKFVFPLTGITTIPAANWDLNYSLKRDKVDVGWVWFTNGIDIPVTPSGWKDLDLSSYVPVGATGVVIEVVNQSSVLDRRGVARAKEDTRDYWADPNWHKIEKTTHRWQVVKLDSNRMIQGAVTNGQVDFILMGYTIGSDPVYVIDSGVTPDITPTANDLWSTIDVANYVADDADGAVLFVVSEDAAKQKYLIREQGGDEVTRDKINEYSNSVFFVGLNPSKHFEAKFDDPDIKLYLLAYTRGSMGFYIVDIPVVDPTIGSWQEIDADDYGIPTKANGVVLHYDGEKDNSWALGFRHGDSTDDREKDVIGDSHYQAAVGLNTPENVFEMFMENNQSNVWIAAYTQAVRLDVVANIDIVIRKSDDTIRATLLTNVADSGNINTDTWQAQNITFAFPGYTVVDDTDYLEIDIYAEASLNFSGESVSVDFRIDDPTLAIADQMRALETVP